MTKLSIHLLTQAASTREGVSWEKLQQPSINPDAKVTQKQFQLAVNSLVSTGDVILRRDSSNRTYVHATRAGRQHLLSLVTREDRAALCLLADQAWHAGVEAIREMRGSHRGECMDRYLTIERVPVVRIMTPALSAWMVYDGQATLRGDGTVVVRPLDYVQTITEDPFEGQHWCDCFAIAYHRVLRESGVKAELTDLISNPVTKRS